MKRFYLQLMILSATLVLTLGACSHKPSKAMPVDSQVEAVSPPIQQHMVLLQEARAEVGNMRAELASLKILMAKQAGELRSLRDQSQSVHVREQDQGQELQNIRSQLLSSQAERDQLRKEKMSLEGQVASVPDTAQLVSDIQAIRASFQNIMSSMKGLVSDITLIKQEMHITSNKGKPQQTKLTLAQPAAALTDQQLPDAKGRIVIQEGATLWKLAKTYKVSIAQLREWNHLSSDLIMTGLRLKVAEPGETGEARPSHVEASTHPVTVLTKKEPIEATLQKTPHPAMGTGIDSPSEPTHILSIASPKSDSHESP